MTKTPVRRVYAEFRGVDFSSDPSIVNLSRSPDALNVWKNYSDTQGTCIETRPGISQLGNFNNKINGMFIYKGDALIHSKNNLYLWSNFPDSPAVSSTLKSNMNNAKSAFAIFNDEAFILDGANFLVYNTTLKDVTANNPYIPTTSINRSPSGGGEVYEDVNVLQPKRKNSFVGDGTSTAYYLDAQNIDSVDSVKVNGTAIASNAYSVNTTQGKITFNTAPAAPSIPGIDNVEITFAKTINSYATRISKCTLMIVYDRRLFFAGNPDYPNAIFHSELNNPYYIRDLAYYEDGTEESIVKSMVVGNNILWIFKAGSQQNDTIFYHTASLDTEGKVYPNYQGNVSVGCYSEAFNYKDDIVFLSRNGLEGISNDEITSKQLLNHRSSLIDSKLVNENNFDLATTEEWEGYLLILVNGHIYLADHRQRFEGNIGYEYEWYFWNFVEDICYMRQYNGNLYLGTSDGKIFIVNGTSDEGTLIESYWTTPMDNFGYGNIVKTTNKRGGVAKIKTIPNGFIKVAEITNNRVDEKDVASFSASGFDFNEIDFSNFSFTTINKSTVIYKIKEKKFLEISLKFYSDQVDKPFGLYSAILEAFVGGYLKK